MRQMLTQAQTSGQYFFFNDTATTEIYTLSLHDALPISEPERGARAHADAPQLHVAAELGQHVAHEVVLPEDRKSTRLNSSHLVISYAVFCLKKKQSFQATAGFRDYAPNAYSSSNVWSVFFF